VECGIITPQIAHCIDLYGLLHDIGHGPYSHESEALCQMNHNQFGLCLLEKMQNEISKIGGDYEFIRNLFLRKNCFSQAVCHPQLGTDKLDYLYRDTRHANEAIGIPMGSFINYVYMQNGEISVELKVIPEVQLLHNAFLYQYGTIYLRKTCLVVHRLLQKAVYALMYDGSTVLSQDRLQTMVDQELDALLFTSTNPTVRILHGYLMNRHLPKTAIALRPLGFEQHERRCRKPIRVFGTSWDNFNLLKRLRNPAEAKKMERTISLIAGIEEDGVLVIPAIDRHAFVPVDIALQDFGEQAGKMSKLFPAHYASLTEKAESFVVIRICVPEKHREKVASSNVSQNIFDYLLEYISS
jgi:HD superfamily phosphohydrolase